MFPNFQAGFWELLLLVCVKAWASTKQSRARLYYITLSHGRCYMLPPCSRLSRPYSRHRKFHSYSTHSTIYYPRVGTRIILQKVYDFLQLWHLGRKKMAQQEQIFIFSKGSLQRKIKSVDFFIFSTPHGQIRFLGLNKFFCDSNKFFGVQKKLK